MPLEGRALEVKERVEALKTKVQRLQSEAADAKALAEGQAPRRPGAWQTYQNLKKDLQDTTRQLREAKLELTKLSGTTGTDPRWALLAETWHVLNELEERGVEIGPRAEALLEHIEFHVPQSKLEGHVGVDA